MIRKIRYRLVFNRARRLNKRGEGLIQIECQQDNRCRYISTNTYIKPDNWSNGIICGTPNDHDKNYVLFRQMAEIEQIELEFIKKGVDVNLPMLMEAVKSNVSPSARLRDFGMAMIAEGERKELTKRNYMTLFNDLDKFRPLALLMDVDYNFIMAYDKYLRDLGVAHNTRIGRERQLRAIMNEARKRDLINKDPFLRFKIQQMVSKKGYLTSEQVRKVERLRVSGKYEIVRDLFLIGCYTGLRYSDVKTLRQESIKDGWITKKMIKTGFIVEIPYLELFDGRLQQLIEKYNDDIGNLTRQTPSNGEVNKFLREMLDSIGADAKITFHSSRHTFATLLGQRNIDITTIQKLLGHKKLTTTQIYREIDKRTIINDIKKTRK